MTLMKRRTFFLVASGISAAVTSSAQRRRVVVRRNTVVVRRGHPIARAAHRTVVVRTARHPVVVGSALVFLPVVAFAAMTVALPPRERLAWHDSETIHRDEDWVECNFGIDQHGDALILEIAGRAELDFADVTFENGEVQVVDFNERTYSNGVYKLYDFPGRRNVRTVRLVARSKSADTRLELYVSR